MPRPNHVEPSEANLYALLADCNLTDDEKAKLVKEFKGRSLEYVINYVDKLKGDEHNEEEKQREKEMEEAKQASDHEREEAERQAIRKKELLEKIKANQTVNRKINEEEYKAQVRNQEQKIDSYLRVKVVLPDYEEVLFGFGEESNMEELFNKVRELSEQKEAKNGFKLRKYISEEVLEPSNKRIIDVLGVRASMLELDIRGSTTK